MGQSSEQCYCLVQKNLDPIPPEILRVAFRAVGGDLVDADAHILSADAFGILAERLTVRTARTLADELAKSGIEIDIVHQGEIPKLPDSLTLRRGGCCADAFLATDSLGRDVLVAWSQVVLVAAGIVPIHEAKRVVRIIPSNLETGRKIVLPMAFCLGTGPGLAAIASDYMESKYAAGLRDESIRYKTEARGLLDVFVGCEPYHYRIEGEKFNYSYLGERRSPKQLENLAMLVGDMVGYAAGAALNRGAVAIREEGLEAKFAYPSKHAFEEETIWLLYRFAQAQGRRWPWMP